MNSGRLKGKPQLPVIALVMSRAEKTSQFIDNKHQESEIPKIDVPL